MKLFYKWHASSKLIAFFLLLTFGINITGFSQSSQIIPQKLAEFIKSTMTPTPSSLYEQKYWKCDFDFVYPYNKNTPGVVDTQYQFTPYCLNNQDNCIYFLNKYLNHMMHVIYKVTDLGIEGKNGRFDFGDIIRLDQDGKKLRVYRYVRTYENLYSLGVCQ